MSTKDHSITTRTIDLKCLQGRTTAFVAEPVGDGPFPAIVFGAEAMGINSFMRETASDLARAGYVGIVPDYFRGNGPSKPDDYTDFSEVMTAIGALDFRQATFDQLAAKDWLASQPNVRGDRISAWGYCTGGTLSWLAAGLDRDFACAVLFFPSQPVFDAIDAKHPASPMDMIWALQMPTLMIYGDQDPLMPEDRLQEMRKRFAMWAVPHDIQIYPGAGHAFTSFAPNMRHDASAPKANQAALTFINANGR